VFLSVCTLVAFLDVMFNYCRRISTTWLYFNLFILVFHNKSAVFILVAPMQCDTGKESKYDPVKITGICLVYFIFV